jgi:hypothetical protein
LYQLLKFTRRHRALVAGTAATVGALVLGLAGTILFAIGEARQRAEADRNAGLADAKTREAQFQAYRARIAAAVAALSAHDVADAARHLDAAPEELRGWEWRHLHSRLDDSSVVVPLPSRAGFLLGAPDRLQVVTRTAKGLRVTDLEDHGIHRDKSIDFSGPLCCSWFKPSAAFASRRGSARQLLTCWTRPAGSFVMCKCLR